MCSLTIECVLLQEADMTKLAQLSQHIQAVALARLMLIKTDEQVQ